MTHLGVNMCCLLFSSKCHKAVSIKFYKESDFPTHLLKTNAHSNLPVTRWMTKVLLFALKLPSGHATINDAYYF